MVRWLSLDKSEQNKIAARVNGLLDKWMPILNLQNWTVVVLSTEEPESDAAMHVDWVPTYRTVVLTINFGLPDTAAQLELGQLLESTVVHELVHFLQSPVADMVTTELADSGVLFTLFHRAFETQTEEIAAVLCKQQQKIEELELQLKELQHEPLLN